MIPNEEEIEFLDINPNSNEVNAPTSKSKNNNNFKYIFLVFLIILVSGSCFYGGYKYNIYKSNNDNKEIEDNKIDTTKVIYAKKEIKKGEKIEEQHLEYKEIPTYLLTSLNIVTDKEIIVKENICTNTKIIEGSYFYQEQLESCDNIISSSNIPSGFKTFELQLNDDNILNNFLKDRYADIYIKINALDSNSMFGKLIDKVLILDVLNSVGKSISSFNEKASSLILLVPDDCYDLLIKASNIDKTILSAIAIKTNDSNIETKIASQYLKDIINNKVS